MIEAQSVLCLRADVMKLTYQGKTTSGNFPTSKFCALTATGTSSGCGPEGMNMLYKLISEFITYLTHAPYAPKQRRDLHL